MYNPDKQVRGAGGRFGGKATAPVATQPIVSPPFTARQAPTFDIRDEIEKGLARHPQPVAIVPEAGAVVLVNRPLPSALVAHCGSPPLHVCGSNLPPMPSQLEFGKPPLSTYGTVLSRADLDEPVLAEGSEPNAGQFVLVLGLVALTAIALFAGALDAIF